MICIAARVFGARCGLTIRGYSYGLSCKLPNAFFPSFAT